jgi:hypothetical protein
MSTPSFVAMMPQEMMLLHTRPLFAFQADVAKPSIIGMTPGHERRVGVITGGSFEGERLRGKILPGGSDWQSLRSDGTLTLDVRCIMETEDGHLIGMTYRGMRHGPKEVLDRPEGSHNPFAWCGREHMGCPRDSLAARIQSAAVAGAQRPAQSKRPLGLSRSKRPSVSLLNGPSQPAHYRGAAAFGLGGNAASVIVPRRRAKASFSARSSFSSDGT